MSAEKLEATKTNIQFVTIWKEKQANAKHTEVQDASNLIESQTVHMKNLETQSTMTESQVLTKISDRDPPATVIDSVSAIAVCKSLVQNSSAEEMVNEASKGFSLITEIDSQLDDCGHQTLPDPLAVMDYKPDVCLHSSEDKQLLTPIVLGQGSLSLNAKLVDAVSQECGGDFAFSLERQQPSTSTDASVR